MSTLTLKDFWDRRREKSVALKDSFLSENIVGMSKNYDQYDRARFAVNENRKSSIGSKFIDSEINENSYLSNWKVVDESFDIDILRTRNVEFVPYEVYDDVSSYEMIFFIDSIEKKSQRIIRSWRTIKGLMTIHFIDYFSRNHRKIN